MDHAVGGIFFFFRELRQMQNSPPDSPGRERLGVRRRIDEDDYLDDNAAAFLPLQNDDYPDT